MLPMFCFQSKFTMARRVTYNIPALSLPAQSTVWGIDEMEPRMVSFNAPYGSVRRTGLGFTLKIDDDNDQPSKSILDGAMGCILDDGC